jgi:diguanylate cyclase (GGDEF)-like protein
VSVVGLLRVWWRQSDHYDQLSAHLLARQMATITRVTIAIIAASLSITIFATIWSSLGPRNTFQLACAVLGSVGAAVAAVFWASRWPNRAQAIRLTVLANASIALSALSQSGPVAALLACTTFATMASYIALFHTAPLMLYNFLIAALVGAFETVRLASRYGVVAGLCGYEVLLILNLAVPFGIQTVVHVLRTDAIRSERDQLTGLLNRRAFHRRTRALLEDLRDEFGHLVITVIDLDRFKQLNDFYGHSRGDEALVEVARALRDSTDGTAVIGRSGGEEFVIADGWHPNEVSRRAQELCDAIAALPFDITASIGTAGAHPDHRVYKPDDLIAALIVAADDAMYVAKRRGGNQTGHHKAPIPPRSAS